MSRIGVLSLQGDFSEHLQCLEQLGQTAVPVRRAADLASCAALILPGGESTAIGVLLRFDVELHSALKQFCAHKPVWGTCAGAVLLANSTNADSHQILGGLAVTVKRNHYGSQVHSFESPLVIAVPELKAASQHSFPFIRAPLFQSIGDSAVVPLAYLPDDSEHPVAVRQGHILATVFHPELDLAAGGWVWFDYFLRQLVHVPEYSITHLPAAQAPANGHANGHGQRVHGTDRLKRGFAQMLRGGVIMDVMAAEQARVAEEAGAVAVMALERIPSEIRAAGGVARTSDPELIRGILQAVSIPVMAKCRIGHEVEAQMLEALGVDMVDESEVLTVADPTSHVAKEPFVVPFVCGCRSLGEALRRTSEGAALIRTKGEAGTGDVSQAVVHYEALKRDIAQLQQQKSAARDEWAAKERVGGDLLRQALGLGRLPLVTFAAGGLATPADAALLMKRGVDGVFVGSGIFASELPRNRARAMVLATAHWREPAVLVQVSAGLGKPMRGIAVDDRLHERMAVREAGGPTL